MRKRSLFTLTCVLCTVASAAGYGCSATTGSGSGFGGSGGSGDGGDVVLTSVGGSTGVGFDTTGAGGTTGSGGPGCSMESQYVYTLDADNSLYKFDPPS